MNRIQSYIYFFIFLALICPNSLYAQVVSGSLNGHDYVDLGLSVKWATCNVGASKPSDYGNYYAWGETSTKSAYYGNNCETIFVDIDDIKGTSRDVAHVKWSGTWRMPTKEDFDELLNTNNCEWTWTTMNGTNGYKVMSKKAGYKGNYIFLPSSGECISDKSYDKGQRGNYWTSTPDENTNGLAYELAFWSGDPWSNYGTVTQGRNYGLTVRPVVDDYSDNSAFTFRPLGSGGSYNSSSGNHNTSPSGSPSKHNNGSYIGDDEIIWKNISQNYNDRPSGILAVAEVGDFCTPDPEDEDMYYNFKSSSSGVFLGNDSSGIVIQGLYLQPDGVSVSAFTLRVNKFGKDYSSQIFIYMGTFDAKGSSAAVVIDFETGYILYRQENGFTLWAENFTIIGDDPSAFEL